MISLLHISASTNLDVLAFHISPAGFGLFTGAISSSTLDFCSIIYIHISPAADDVRRVPKASQSLGIDASE